MADSLKINGNRTSADIVKAVLEREEAERKAEETRKKAEEARRRASGGINPPPAEPPPPDERYSGIYILMDQTSRYAQGVHKLREACEQENNPVHPQFVLDAVTKLYRPLTFKENIEARVSDYNTLKNADGSDRTIDERLRFFKKWLDSCTGIAYKKGTTQFMVIPQSRELITIAKKFKDNFISVNYGSIPGVELDSSQGKYGEFLTQTEVINHEAWRAAVENDIPLLQTYTEIVFTELKRLYKRDTGMRFYVRQNTEHDELRALFVYYLDYGSSADGSDSLNSVGSFLRGSPTSSSGPTGGRAHAP